MATITKPMALDESFNTTETNPRSIADVLAGIEGALAQGMGRHANEVSYDNTTSGLSADDVQEAVDELAEEKVDKVTGKGLSTNDYTDDEKSKLEGIEAGAQVNPTIDSELSESSTNAVQNKVVKDALDGKADNADVAGTQTVSGNPITLTDAAPINAESLVVEFSPKQDLHGQSAPYVGGAGVNKFDLQSAEFNASAIYGLELSKDGEYVKLSGTWTRAQSGSTDVLFKVASVPYVQNGVFKCFDLSTDAQNCLKNNNVSWASDGVGGVLISLVNMVQNQSYDIKFKIMVYVGTEPTSYSPYSNICPITGYTECDVEDVGFNQWDEEWEVGDIDNNGQPQSSSTLIRTKNFNPCQPSTTYYVKIPTGISIYVKYYDGDKNFISPTVTPVNNTITTPNNCKFFKFVVGSAYGTTYNNDISINYPSTDHDYQPYHSSNATIQFGQTVYGGSVDFLTGELTVDMASVDLGTLNWSYQPTDLYFTVVISDKAYGSMGNKNCFADRYINAGDVTVSNMPDKTVKGSTSSGRIYIKDSSYTDVDTFKTAMSGAQLCYELAEPFTIHLTPQELQLLKQYNNITTNGTTINLDYIPDNSIGDAVRASEEYTDRAVNRGIEQHLEMPYLRILDNDVDTEVKNYRLYYRMIASAYTLVNLAEMLQHRFLFVEVVQNPSGTSNDKLLHSALIDSRTIDGFEYQTKAGTGDTVCIKTNIAENKLDLYVQSTGTHTSGDPTDYYVTIRLVD